MKGLEVRNELLLGSIIWHVTNGPAVFTATEWSCIHAKNLTVTQTMQGQGYCTQGWKLQQIVSEFIYESFCEVIRENESQFSVTEDEWWTLKSLHT